MLPTRIYRSTVYRPIDTLLNDHLLNLFIGALIQDGKKSKAERILREAFVLLKSKGNSRPAQIFAEATHNC